MHAHTQTQVAHFVQLVFKKKPKIQHNLKKKKPGLNESKDIMRVVVLA